jgi:non-ribosomal peptide synthetase-like protein
VGSAILFFGSLLIGLVFVGTVPRLLNLALAPDKVYPLYGFHYWMHGTIRRVTNIKFFTYLFGDSSYIVNYLRWIGYDLPRVVQTGSNFGMDLKHDNPFLVTIGSGTMVADGLSIINADYSNTSFRVSKATIGADNFVGNFVAYPSQGRTGDNCLLATKVMVPLDGEVREGTGLLGSPSFEIPRSVLRDRSLEQDRNEELARKLGAKDKHNLATMGLFLLAHWFISFVMICLSFEVAELYVMLGAPIVALAMLFAVLFRLGYFIFVERLSIWFKSLQPQHYSIYDPRFWAHERYWKLMATSSQMAILDGTPFKGLAWRLLGVRIGKRVFDDGCGMTEKTMVAIGDGCTLNMASIIHPHSQEDGGFKSDRIEIGSGCTLGVGSWVHYGTKLNDGAQIAPDAFVMKGQEVGPNTRWAENPAREMRM